MLSRHYLRAKALQALYAQTVSDTLDYGVAEKAFRNEIDKLNDLGIMQLSTLPEFIRVAEYAMEEGKMKFNPTEFEKNPSRKIIDNIFIARMADNYEYRKYEDRLNINWSTLSNIYRKVYNKVKDSDLVRAYVSTSESSFQADKEFALEMFRCLMNEDALRLYIYEKGLVWEDDFDQIAQYNFMMIKALVDAEFNESTPFPLMYDPRLEKDKDDYEFARTLLIESMHEMSANESIIRAHLQNWEFERVAHIDVLLINMAITEFTHCPSIAEKVTVNEYIELAKEFSTDKSKLFINGILDKILIELKVQGKVVKTGRGLYDASDISDESDVEGYAV